MANFMPLCILLTIFLFYVKAEKKVVFCYYGSWATYRNGNGKCDIEHLNPFVCTHLVYAFIGLEDDYSSIRIMDQWLELPSGRDNFRKFNKLKEMNPELKTLVAIGGWNEGSAKYSTMSNDSGLRSRFIKNALNFVRQYDFDGLDLDWEYPNKRDTKNGLKDIAAFTSLVSELKHAFSEYGLLVTAAVGAAKSAASTSYDVAAISRHLDYINIMTYDLHGGWDSVTGFNAGLYAPAGAHTNDELTVTAAVEYWISQGAPAEKIVLGAPLYGRTFRLTDSSHSNVGAPSSGPGIAGQYTYENGMIGYNEFCEKQISEKSWQIRWDESALVPYAVSGNNWISFDNPESIKYKAKYVLQKNLAGMMVWSIETDDFRGTCHGRKFEMLTTINEELGRDIGADAESSELIPDPEVPDHDESGSSNPDALCTQAGYVRDPKDCSIFYLCLKNGQGRLVAYLFRCPRGLVWDTKSSSCNYPSKVDCNNYRHSIQLPN